MSLHDTISSQTNMLLGFDTCLISEGKPELRKLMAISGMGPTPRICNNKVIARLKLPAVTNVGAMLNTTE